jgi:thiol-disulfide isomerase/thioredoxin
LRRILARNIIPDVMKTTTALLASLVAGAAIALSGASCEGSGPAPVASTPDLPSPFTRTMPSLEGATGWINSAPLDANALRGKVVVVDFWTYTCINWMRTAPWLRHWADKYKDAGLVVIGVHSPEFGFEQDPQRVRRLTAALDLGYPVAIDSQHAIWRAFRNQYWPALYLVDAHGKIRHQQFGETDYDKAEAVLQSLLKEAGARNLDTTIAPVVGKGPEAAADWTNLKSPETYIGFSRAERFASPGGVVPSRQHMYAAPSALRDNQWALVGDWTITDEAARSNKGSASVRYRFHARDVHLVMGASMDDDKPVRIRVRIDGKPPGAAHGTDIDADGVGIVSEHRMYQLIRQPAPIEDREIEILFFDRGVELFAFTFG